MTPAVGTQELIKLRTEGTALSSPYKKRAEDLTIEDDVDYAAADQILGEILNSRRVWKTKTDAVREPAYAALQGIYKLIKDYDSPLEQSEQLVRGKMKAFKLEEQRQLRIEEDARQAEITRARLEAEEKERKANAARTKPMREKLLTQAAQAAQSAAELEVQGPTQGVKVSGSSAIAKKIPQVTDLKRLLAGIISGEIPDDILTINQVELNACYRIDPQIVSSWPGITIMDDVSIRGRSR